MFSNFKINFFNKSKIKATGNILSHFLADIFMSNFEIIIKNTNNTISENFDTLMTFLQ